jgi:hypothetical protein
MRHSIPIGRIFTDQEFQNPMVPASQLLRRERAGTRKGRGEAHDPKGSSRQEDPEPNGDRMMTKEKGREGVDS